VPQSSRSRTVRVSLTARLVPKTDRDNHGGGDTEVEDDVRSRLAYVVQVAFDKFRLDNSCARSLSKTFVQAASSVRSRSPSQTEAFEAFVSCKLFSESGTEPQSSFPLRLSLRLSTLSLIRNRFFSVFLEDSKCPRVFGDNWRSKRYTV